MFEGVNRQVSLGFPSAVLDFFLSFSRDYSLCNNMFSLSTGSRELLFSWCLIFSFSLCLSGCGASIITALFYPACSCQLRLIVPQMSSFDTFFCCQSQPENRAFALSSHRVNIRWKKQGGRSVSIPPCLICWWTYHLFWSRALHPYGCPPGHRSSEYRVEYSVRWPSCPYCGLEFWAERPSTRIELCSTL